MRTRQALTIAASGAALLCVVGASLAAPSGGWRIVARASSLNSIGAGSAAIPIVRVRHPHALAIRAFAPPQRSMVADWIIVCSASRKIGHFRWRSTSAPMFHILRRGLGAPRACDVTVSAEFNGLVVSGEIRLQLLQR